MSSMGLAGASACLDCIWGPYSLPILACMFLGNLHACSYWLVSQSGFIGATASLYSRCYVGPIYRYSGKGLTVLNVSNAMQLSANAVPLPAYLPI